VGPEWDQCDRSQTESSFLHRVGCLAAAAVVVFGPYVVALALGLARSWVGGWDTLAARVVLTVVVIAGVVATIGQRRNLRSALWKRRGLCPACGYDLRATPDRCPECGNETQASG
jgi:hypothetical protein